MLALGSAGHWPTEPPFVPKESIALLASFTSHSLLRTSAASARRYGSVSRAVLPPIGTGLLRARTSTAAKPRGGRRAKYFQMTGTAIKVHMQKANGVQIIWPIWPHNPPGGEKPQDTTTTRLQWPLFSGGTLAGLPPGSSPEACCSSHARRYASIDALDTYCVAAGRHSHSQRCSPTTKE